MVDKSDVAATYYHAPHPLTAKWNQTALKRVRDRWKEERPTEYETLLTVCDGERYPFLFIDIDNMWEKDGPNGYPTDFYLRFSIDDEFINLDDFEERGIDHVAEAFASEWVDEIVSVVESGCPESLSTREYLVYTAYRETPERKVADAFGVSVGTVRGTVGRVRKKIDKARTLLDYEDSLGHFADLDQSTFGLSQDVMDTVSDEELPVQSFDTPEGFDTDYTSYAPEQNQ